MKTIVQLTEELKDYFLGKDTAVKQAVESNIAPVEADASSASRTYVVGDQLFLNDVLYDVTSPISVEDAIVVGTNITAANKLSADIQTLESETYNVNDTAITEVASNDLLPIYDTSASGKKKMAVSDFIGGLVSNPNLLDNPWFTVNQRGANSYAGSTARVYTFDRWYIDVYAPDITVTDNNDGTITIANTGSTDNLQFAQLLESDLLISGKTYTLTCDVVAYTGSVRMLFAGNVSPYPAIINKLVDKTGYIIGNGVYDGTSNTYKVSFAMYANSSITIRAVKLELGSVSTLAQDTAPNYGTELLKCQRYFQRYDFTDQAALGSGHIYGSYGMVLKFLPVAMRVDPTLTVNGGLSNCRLLCNGQAKVVTAISKGGVVTVGNAITLIVNTAEDLGLNFYMCTATLRPESDSTLSLDLSADL